MSYVQLDPQSRSHTRSPRWGSQKPQGGTRHSDAWGKRLLTEEYNRTATAPGRSRSLLGTLRHFLKVPVHNEELEKSPGKEHVQKRAEKTLSLSCRADPGLSTCPANQPVGQNQPVQVFPCWEPACRLGEVAAFQKPNFQQIVRHTKKLENTAHLDEVN